MKRKKVEKNVPLAGNSAPQRRSMHDYNSFLALPWIKQGITTYRAF